MSVQIWCPMISSKIVSNLTGGKKKKRSREIGIYEKKIYIFMYLKSFFSFTEPYNTKLRLCRNLVIMGEVIRAIKTILKALVYVFSEKKRLKSLRDRIPR